MRGRSRPQRPVGLSAWAGGQGPAGTLVSKAPPPRTVAPPPRASWENSHSACSPALWSSNFVPRAAQPLFYKQPPPRSVPTALPEFIPNI